MAPAAGAAYWRAPSGAEAAPVLAWFALPLVLALGTWTIARFEVQPSTGWATEAGEALLRRAARRGLRGRRPGASSGGLTGLALHGPDAPADPGLRAALHSSGA
ncbi:hypothetical protein ACFC0M_35320 [Streptomyces sp. NPDC056149]|uniref:hypothetical protein n=1 Tax=Streptomyces sp. NPDC056149 TaxID=3345728 RepID=UPI0035DA3775